MAESKELKKIKKEYGENFMKLCRSLFPTLLEQEGRLYEILSSSFSTNSNTLYEDIVGQGLEEDFKDYIYSKVDVEDPEKKKIVEKTPYELLEEAGYDLTECLTEEEIQEFKKYYKPGEELCTFRGGRLNRCVVFFAVKKDADKIKREDFGSPKREDEYGTSVMGIQFTRQGMCTVSIKNRYNHTVNNPDATYGNDLDRIIPGLTKGFATLLQKEYGLELNSTNIEQFEIPGYVVANDGRYYKYNMEIDGDYYCPGNIIIKQGGEVRSVGNPEEGLLIDYFYIDKKNKRIEVCPKREDSFVDGLQDIEKIEVVKSEDENIHRIIKVYLKDVDEPVLIGIDKNNQIVKYENKNISEIASNFLCYNEGLRQLSLPNLTQVGDYFLNDNEGLRQLSLPNLTQVGSSFLCNNEGLSQLDLQNLTQVGDCFLFSNEGLSQLDLQNLTQVGDCFLFSNEGLRQLFLPNLTYAGDCFLFYNEGLRQLSLPSLEQVGSSFLDRNRELSQLDLPNITQVGDNFLNDNEGLIQLSLPSLERVGGSFLYDNKGLSQLDLPNLTQVGDNFLNDNEGLIQLSLPSLEQVGDSFLGYNRELSQLDLPNLTQVGNSFLDCNKGLRQLSLPSLEQVGNTFLANNEKLIKLELPNLPELAEKFSDIIDRNIKVKETQDSGEKITSQSIAQLDKENQLTTSEINIVGRIINKIKRWVSKGKDGHE